MKIKKIETLYLDKMSYLTNQLSLELEDVKIQQNHPIRLLQKKNVDFEGNNIKIDELSEINFSLWNDSTNVVLEQLHLFFIMDDKSKEVSHDLYNHHMEILKRIDVKINIIKENIVKQKEIILIT